MRTRPSLIIGTLTVTLLLPAMTLAAEHDSDLPADMDTDILDLIDLQPTPPPPVMIDGKGGGGGMIYPGPGGGIQVDASVTKEVTPDFIGINAYCDLGRRKDRDIARDAARQLLQDIMDAVGKDGQVRRSGGIGVYPFYDETGQLTEQFGSSLNLMVRITRAAAAERIFAFLEDKNCNPNWDVRLLDTLDHETSVIDELTRRLHARKAIFEKLLSRKLTTVHSASLFTWVDGYATYDPEENRAEATTTLSVSFDPGARATIRTPRK